MPPSIFQQIVLPYLVQISPRASPRVARSISSTSTRSRAPANTDTSYTCSPSSSSQSTSSTWEYMPPVRPVSYHTGHDPPSTRPTYPDTAVLRPLPRGKSGWKRKDEREDTTRDKEVQAFLRKLESLSMGQKETVVMAMERIISTSSSGNKSGPSEKRQVERQLEQDRGGSDDKTVKDGGAYASVSDPHSRKKPFTRTSPDVKSDESSPSLLALPQPLTTSEKTLRNPQPTSHTSSQTTFIPPSIHSLLQSRLYRLAVYHLLQTPEYTVDQNLLDRVAGCMKRDGAGKLARRLERGWDGRQAERSGIDQGQTGSGQKGASRENDTAGLKSATSSTGNPHRLPPDTWQPPRRSAPPPDGPLPADTLHRSKALTSAYNAHLSRSLFSPKKSSSSLSSNQSYTTSRPLSRPSTNLAQLRQLLIRIEKLEKHRGFKPDWVTANLVVKCWMLCASSDSVKGKKIWTNGSMSNRNARRWNDKGVDEERLGVVELRGIFEFVRKIYQGTVEEQYGHGSPGLKQSFGHCQPDHSNTASVQSTSSSSSQPDPQSPNISNIEMTPLKPASPDTSTQRISFTRHIRPFAHDLARAFRRIGDQEGFERVVGWQKRMRERMEGG